MAKTIGLLPGAKAAIKKGENLVKTRDTILDSLMDTIQPHLKIVKQLDSDALIGSRGSLIRGFKGPHKGNAPFDPNDFDVDAFIVSDKLSAQFSNSRFRDGGAIPEIKQMQESIEKSLRQNQLFSGLRKTTTTNSGKVIEDKFTFRIFTKKEIEKQDSQLFFIE